MTEVVSIKFKNRGKAYFFDPSGLQLHSGDVVIVDTANGMEIATCSVENHLVDDHAVVQPLRRVLRVATQMDLRTDELNRQREQSAMAICKEKILEHELDMKLVDVECNFEGNKTTFFFTSDGRVDFRALVKDLAAILHNRIERRQIGVRDEAKMLGGLGICGRPYCCSQFLDDFHPVSTKMAKIQSLSLNPAKISGSCGRLMCCLRYEQEAYEDLVKKVPKQGSFVETKDGYGTAVQVNLLRSTVKVKLDDDRDDSLHEYKSYELAAVPGGRPKEGVEPAHVLNYVEPEEEPDSDEPIDEWTIPTLLVTPVPETPVETDDGSAPSSSKRRRSRRGKKPAAQPAAETVAVISPAPAVKPEPEKKSETASSSRKSRHRKKKPSSQGHSASSSSAEGKPPIIVEAKPAKAAEPKYSKTAEAKTVQTDAQKAGQEKSAKSVSHHRRPHHRRRSGNAPKNTSE